MKIRRAHELKNEPTLVIYDKKQTAETSRDELNALIRADHDKYEDKTGLRYWREKDTFILVIDNEADLNDLQKELRAAVKAVAAEKYEKAQVVVLSDLFKKHLRPALEALFLADYAFDRYMDSGIEPIDPSAEDKDEDEKKLNELAIIIDDENADIALCEANVITNNIIFARNLVNEPANTLTPTALSERAAELGKKEGFDVEIFGVDKIRELGMDAYYSVAKGSDEEPKLIRMTYKGNPDSDKHLALVGKGLTYDSGGYAIKPTAGMVTMFCDMGGSAAVIGAIGALAGMRAKVNVTAIVAACENMISGRAFKNGDIIGSLSGKKIEVVNTDAEGRLTLADAVTYADKVVGATHIIDIATLTGAVVIGLGNTITGVLADDEDLWNALQKASDRSGDKVWRLPIDKDLAKCNESKRADIKNSGGRPGGSITAGLFVRAFAGKKPWMHMDIAATAYNDSDNGRQPEGATGCGVELLYDTAKTLFE
mgnify:CR=1 FL=1